MKAHCVKGAIYRPKKEASPNSETNSNTVEKIHFCCLNPKSLRFYGIPRFAVGFFSAPLFLCMPLYSPVVMTNFGCQPSCIWNQLKPELLGSPVMSFLNQIM